MVTMGCGDTSPREHVTASNLHSGICRFVCLVKIMENSLGSRSVAASRGGQGAPRGVDSGLGPRLSELDEEQ